MTTLTKPSDDAIDIHTVCDFVLLCLSEAGESCNVLKLQKLLYYVQSWSLAFEGNVAFEGEFEAWVHGPVNRDIYSRFADTKTMYSSVNETDVLRNRANAAEIMERNNPELRFNIKAVLESYGHFTGTQLEELTHNEEPWIEARQDCRASERCESTISQVTMRRYYSARLA